MLMNSALRAQFVTIIGMHAPKATVDAVTFRAGTYATRYSIAFPTAAAASDWRAAAANHGHTYTDFNATPPSIHPLRFQADRSLPDRLLGQAYTGLFAQVSEHIKTSFNPTPGREDRLGLNKGKKTMFYAHNGNVHELYQATHADGVFTFEPLLTGLAAIGVTPATATAFLDNANATATTTTK